MTRSQNYMDDPFLLRAKIAMLERELVDTRINLELARQHACHWEHECKTVRKELNAKRQGATTAKIRKPK